MASLDGGRFADVRAVEVDLTAAYRAAGVNPPAPLRKAVLDALGERDEAAPPETDSRGRPLPDADLRDTENVPLSEEVAAYMAREVLPFVTDAWVDESKERIGYEINITRYFYEYQPLRPLAEIDAEIKVLEADILDLLHGVTT